MKQLTTLLAVAVISMVFAGCAASGPPVGRVTTSYDKFTDLQINDMQFGYSAWLRRATTSGRTNYLILVLWTQYGEAQRNRSLIFLIDGQRVSIEGTSELEDVAWTGYSFAYTETNAFRIDSSLIRRIANADSVELRFYGENSTAPVVFKPNQIQSFKKFEHLFVDGAWDRMTDIERDLAKSEDWPPELTP